MAVVEDNSAERSFRTPQDSRTERLWPFAALGLFLGVLFTKSEIISWFRIQEMFRFQSFHMYGIIGSAVVVAALGIQLIRKYEASSATGRPMEFPQGPWVGSGYQYWIGGTLFGLGWGLLGACPGPIYVLLGQGVSVMVVALVSALAGAWVYALVKGRLPHN